MTTIDPLFTMTHAPSETARDGLSIVIPNLDSPWLGRTLDALDQEGAPGDGMEVLVVGRDAPGQLQNHEAVRFLETDEAVNPATARNLGVEAATHDRILFTDSDCAPQSGWVDGLAGALKESPVAGGAVTFPKGGNVWALADNIASFHELLGDRPAETDSRGAIGSLNLAVRRDAWERVGPFDAELTTSEDVDWVLRARAAGLATAFVPTAVVEHAAVRASRQDLEGHAAWYGRNFRDFCRRHPGTFATGPTWSSRRRLAFTAPIKALTGAAEIFLRHRSLRSCLRAFPGVVTFKRAWYRSVLENW